MNQQLNRFIDIYGKAIKDNTAAIFAGAGLSIPVGFVNWRELLKEIAYDLSLDIDKENDLIAIAQYHFNEHGNKRHRLNQLLIDEFTQGTALTQNHKILASLPIQTYWTTNYDKLIEKALDQEGKTPDIKITQANLSTNIPKRDAIVYKMHGDVSQPDQAVLTKDDYEGYNEKRSLFTTSLQGDLISKTFLFIGFSFDDPNLEYILSRIRILLGENQREHYCFFKKINRNDFNTESEYTYAEVKQQLKSKDLKRYSINPIFIDDYSEITEVLLSIKKRVFRSTVFISGAAKTYEPKNEKEALTFIHKLSFAISSKGYKIISGFGLGVGSSIINGVLDYVFSTKYRHLDNFLILRPFPQTISGNKTKKEINTDYRNDMISSAGIAVFIYGNKDNNGAIQISNGMLEEFDVALSNNVIPLPVGATGYASEELWNKVITTPLSFYPNNEELLNSIKKIGDKKLSDDELIETIIKCIDILQNQY